MVARYLGVVAVVAGFLLASDGQAAEVGVAARVNGAEITNAQLQRSFRQHLDQQGINIQSLRNPAHYKTLKSQVLDVLIGQELLWQEAEARGFVAEAEDVDAALARAGDRFTSPEAFHKAIVRAGFTEGSFADDLKRELSVRRLIAAEIVSDVTIDEQAVHDFYAANADRFVSPEMVRARHILVKLPQDADAAAVEAAEQRINDIRAEAEDGSDFAELARQRSDGPSAARGGDLGFFARGQMVPAFEAVAFALTPGNLSDVVRTQFGFHVIKLEARRETAPIPEEAVREDILAHLRGRRVEEALETWVQTLRAEANIEVLVPQ